MSAKGKEASGAGTGQIMSAFEGSAKPAETLGFSHIPLGQRYPAPCPQHYPHPEGTPEDELGDPLGEPMTIREVARVLGCSEWTIRQRYLPLGLPHFRLSPTGKLLFFHNQILRWVLEKQRQKGGYIR
jgi:hypothetical protein